MSWPLPQFTFLTFNPTFLLYNLHHIFLIYDNIVAKRRMPIPVIFTAIADCKRRKGAISCVCSCTGECLIQFYCIFIFVREFPTFYKGPGIKSVLISPEGHDDRSGVSQLFFERSSPILRQRPSFVVKEGGGFECKCLSPVCSKNRAI